MPKKVNKIRTNSRSKSTPTKLRRKPTMNERKVVTAPAAPEPIESLDKVRDILFGAQSRDFEYRFAFLKKSYYRKPRAPKRMHIKDLNH